MVKQVTTEDRLGPPRQTGLRTTSSPYSEDQQRIMVALAETAVMRGAEAGQTYLHAMTLRLSKQSVDGVLRALASISDTLPAQGEPTIPTLPRILAEMRWQNHPLRHLREIVGKLAKAFGRDMDEEFLETYQDAVGHRTDQDIDKAYKEILSREELRFMPSPGTFLAACGVPKVYRDGSKPE